MPDDDEAGDWIRAHVEPTGPIELVHDWPWGLVRRAPTVDGFVWFKAPAPRAAFEVPLTAALAARRPELLPEVLAHDHERARLLLGDAGERLEVGGDPAPWLSVLPRYAELQRGEAVHVAAHLEAGVPDRRLARFPELYEDLLARDVPPRLRTFEPRFVALCDELAGAGVPETVQHDDLHGNNVYRRDGSHRILDWGDACVSHPFLTAEVTFVHLFLETDDPWLERLRDAYLEPWGGAELRDAFAVARRLGPFAHVFKELYTLEEVPQLPLLLERCLAVVDESYDP